MSLYSFFPAKRTRRNDPYPFDDLKSEISRVFDQFNHFPSVPRSVDLATADDYAIQPDIDVTESETAIEVTVDVPGVKEEDIDVHLDGRMLTMEGKRDEEKTEETKNYKIVERSSGSFKRSLRLPFNPDSNKIDANLEAGVLTIKIAKPVKEETQAQRITVSSGEKKKKSGKTDKKVGSKDKDAAPA